MGKFLESPAMLFAAPLVEVVHREASLEGAAVGPYRVLRELARGGMGVVYLAERADGQFEQRVALKLIKRGMDSDEIHRRFLAERQILARLNHPHIARFSTAASPADGRPWFAMEYVEGRPITRLLRGAAARACPSGFGCSRTCATPCGTPTRTWSSTATSSPRTSW